VHARRPVSSFGNEVGRSTNSEIGKLSCPLKVDKCTSVLEKCTREVEKIH